MVDSTIMGYCFQLLTHAGMNPSPEAMGFDRFLQENGQKKS